jgi:Tfp pilus assembly protein PilF
MAKIDAWLKGGIEAAKAGEKDKARRLLEQVVEADPDNETAWLWLSAAVDTRGERIRCLEMALKLHPANQDASPGGNRASALRSVRYSEHCRG